MLIDKIKITHFARFLMFTLFSNPPPPRLLPLASPCALLPPALPPSLFPPLLFSVLGGWPEDSCAKPLAYIQVHSTQTDTAGCCSGFPGREQEPSTRGERGGWEGWRKREVEQRRKKREHAEREGARQRDGGEGVRRRRVVVKSFFITGFIFHCRVLPLCTSLYFSLSVVSSFRSPPLIPLCLSLSPLFLFFLPPLHLLLSLSSLV